MILPSWRFTWARWMLGHAEFKQYGPKNYAHRPSPPVPPPGQIPQEVKDWYFRTFAKEIAALQKPPPITTPPSPFDGVGLFVADNPAYVHQFKGKIRWVAVQVDGEFEDGRPMTTPDTVADLRSYGFDVHGWYSWDHDPQYGFNKLNLTGFIGQAEGPGQLTRCYNFSWTWSPRYKALISNVTFMNTWPENWYCFGEAYLNANPSASPTNLEYEARKRGATRYSPSFGTYDATEEQPPLGKRVLLSEYLSIWKGENWSAWRAETFDAKDEAYLLAK